MIWLRADGGKEIGTGHIMRCLSVADALRERNEKVCFLTSDDSAAAIITKRGHCCRILQSDYRRPEEEIGKLLSCLEREKDGVFLADSYFVTKKYLKKVREYMPTCYIDDLGRTDMDADLLINYNIFANRAQYDGAKESVAAFLLGPEYAPLRREFKRVEYSVRERAKRVFLTTGGSDKYDLAGKILREALSCETTRKLEYCVVSGIYNEHLDGLKQLENAFANVKVFCNVDNIWELMRTCDIAVTAGGSTMYELCAVGIPIICFSFVDNQEKIVEGFADRGIVDFGGNYLKSGARMISDVTYHISSLAEDTDRRRLLSGRQKALVDGRGADRIAECLLGLKNTGCAEGNECV